MAKDVLSLLSDKIHPHRSNIVFFLQRTRDDWYWKQLFHDKKRSWISKAQKLDAQEHIDHGSDLAVARFVISRCRGQIQDERGIWLKRIKELPPSYIKSFKITAINASRCRLMTEGTDNFAGLDHLRSLDLSYNQYIDDFSCDQIARQFRKSKTLENIDLSHNKQISVNGLNILFRIPSIRQISAVNTSASRYHDIDLFSLVAEEERNCKVITSEEQEGDSTSFPLLSSN